MDRESERAQAAVGADVRGRLLAADMLLAGGQGQHEAALAFGVDGLAGEPARHLADELLLAGEQADIGPAEIQADADRLALADDDVGAHLARRLRIAPSATGSVTTAISSAPFAWARAASSERSPIRPRMSGYWTTTPLVSPSIAPSSRAVSGSATSSGGALEHVAGEARHRLRDRDIMRMQARARGSPCRGG